ncbi:uncharacterized protein LOC111026503 [Myzus persicae]|uniref:uncharacterized protein LOC111026503 n=1 Tax=Myzus persicae TaxID=13164 RepID=UPI000B930DAB|nr:uncharacterized protein LOC111026503 [Myzus persicae]
MSNGTISFEIIFMLFATCHRGHVLRPIVMVWQDPRRYDTVHYSSRPTEIQPAALSKEQEDVGAQRRLWHAAAAATGPGSGSAIQTCLKIGLCRRTIENGGRLLETDPCSFCGWSAGRFGLESFWLQIGEACRVQRTGKW